MQAHHDDSSDAGVRDLQKAIAFLDQCRADPLARETGALRDAHEWLESAARKVAGASRPWTVARYPDGSWGSGGSADDPDYANCTIFLIPAASREEAERKAKAQYRKSQMRGAQ